MKKKTIITLGIISIILIIIGIILLNKNIQTKKNTIEILDATYKCNEGYHEKFYEDDNYTYFFPCQKSNSVYVKLKDNNKLLVKTALEENKVSIKELEEAGLEIIKTKK